MPLDFVTYHLGFSWCDQRVYGTGKSFSEALMLESVNP